MTRHRNLGEALSSALEAGPSRSVLTAQRQQILATLAKPTRSTRPYWIGGLAVAAVAAATLLVQQRFERRSLNELRGAWLGKSLSEKARVVAPPERAETLSFSDGSQLKLGALSEVVLSTLSPEQAHLELGRGHVDASIRKGTGRAWTLGAGPYSVHVVGTEFSVDWDERTRFFAVNVREGRVLVTGGELRLGGVLLGAGERIERQDPPAAHENLAPAASVTLNEAPQPAASLPLPPPRATVVPSAEDDFRSQAARGNYSAAIAAARRAGFDRLSQELSAKDLLLLANTARYAGSSLEAHTALLKLRERFPGSPSATHAALLLASQAEDHDKNSIEAERWLRTFLKESPQGELAAGARARLLSMLLKRGAEAEAEQVARDYLRLHPNGQHAAQARAVLHLSP